jgi:hypothetical protein
MKRLLKPQEAEETGSQVWHKKAAKCFWIWAARNKRVSKSNKKNSN